MTLEEYKDTYFRRWQKRLNTQCWFIFGATAVLSLTAAFFMYFTKELDTPNFIRHIILRTVIPALLQIAVMTPVAVAINNKTVGWKKGCRFVVFQLFWILAVISVFNAHYSVVLVLPAFTMLTASSIADKKLLKAIFIASFIAYIPAYCVFALLYTEYTFFYKILMLAIDLLVIMLSYNISRALLRSQSAQISFISHNYRKQAALAEELQLEPLTRLFNRRALAETVDRLMHSDTKNEALGIAFLDLDDFKKVNDKFGHATGDAVLISLAEIIIEILETNRNAFRYGGDEFVILFRGKTLPEIESVVEKIMEKFKNMKFDYLPEEANCSMSVGISIYKEGWTSKDWFNSADKAAYKAKQNGKNRYEIAD